MMEENTESFFRVSVNLKRFFEDERALCYVSVQAGRRVRWLQRRLRRLFALPRRLCLTSRGHLLPPDEPVTLLRPDDPVEVIPMAEDCNWICDEKLIDKSVNTIDANDDEHYQPKRKENKSEHKKIKGNIFNTEAHNSVCSDRNDNEININSDICNNNDNLIEAINDDEHCQPKQKENISEHKKMKGNIFNTETDNSVCSDKNDDDITMNSDICNNDDDNLIEKELSVGETPEEKRLQQIKEQALAMLECYEEKKVDYQSLPNITSDQSRPHRVRRRVRRRRRRKDLEPSLDEFTGHNQNTELQQSPPLDVQVSAPPVIESAPALELQCSISRCSPSLANGSASEASDVTPVFMSVHVAPEPGPVAVMQNIEAAPRAPRLVRTLVDDISFKPLIE